MSVSECFGEAFGNRLHGQATSFATRALRQSTLAVSELRYDNPEFILSTPPREENAFVVAVHLKLYERYEYWENGRAAPVSTLRPGETIIYDVKRKPTFHLNCSFHSVHFYLPMDALDALADEADARRIEELHYRPGASRADPVLRNMAEVLLPLFHCPGCASRLFIDHLMLAVGHHAASTYGGMQPLKRTILGGLTAAQERRAKDLIASNLSGNLSLAALATECGLSTSRFNKAFRKSVGMPPHRWLVQQRIALAKTLLRNGSMKLTDVALACGFSDQSHFTRCFSACAHMSPGQWRRSVEKL
ncbi:MAG TPA: AraC family transcriptional regulator [Pseudolabrys sp.]|jgi:AraC-like DNA-binding protein|nr:AraC family transcriptional regulator [Pseudolabrys sp.]